MHVGFFYCDITKKGNLLPIIAGGKIRVYSCRWQFGTQTKSEVFFFFSCRPEARLHLVPNDRGNRGKKRFIAANHLILFEKVLFMETEPLHTSLKVDRIEAPRVDSPTSFKSPSIAVILTTFQNIAVLKMAWI